VDNPIHIIKDRELAPYSVLHIAYHIGQLGQGGGEEMVLGYEHDIAQFRDIDVDCGVECSERRLLGAGLALLPRGRILS